MSAGETPRGGEPTDAQRLEWIAAALHGDAIYGKAWDDPLFKQAVALRATVPGGPAPSEEALEEVQREWWISGYLWSTADENTTHADAEKAFDSRFGSAGEAPR